LRSQIIKLGFAFLVATAACQGPDEYFRGPLDASGIGGVPISGQGGSATGGSNPGTGGQPTGLGGLGGTSSGSAGSPAGTAGTFGMAGTNGAAGTMGRGGTTGSAGTTGGRGGTTGSAGTNGTAGTMGRGGTTGSAGTTGGRGGTTGSAGTNGAAGTMGRGGTTGNAGTNGAAGTMGAAGAPGTVLFSDDFESNTVGATTANNWSRTGGSSNDWMIATDGTKVLEQANATSSTVRTQSLTGAGSSGAPWSGAISASARVKIIATGSSNQAALLCVRFNDPNNRYCGGLVPGGVQILTVVGGTAGGSAVFSATVTTGTFYDLRISVDASNALTVYLGGTQRGTYTPAAMTNGTVAVGTQSIEASFDNISVTRP
jgi:hypothetical protein